MKIQFLGPKILFPVLFIFLALSCKSRNKNYVTYYNKVNEIDSIYRIANQPIIAIKKYKKLFRKYEPKNQERIEELQNYIYLSDRFGKKFGGKKTLGKFINTLAPYRNYYQPHLPLFHKYGIDSIEVKARMQNWKNSREKVLIDSLTTLFIRDQEGGRADVDIMMKNDNKNALLMKWIFENYGFPSMDKVGIFGNNDVPMHLLTFFSHMAASDYYPYFETEMRKYVSSGHCLPRDYATMVDRHYLQIRKEDILYGMYIGYDTVIDTTQVNINRKTVGLPTIEHSSRLRKDFFKKLKKRQLKDF